MPCPECGSYDGELRGVTSVETHGLECGPYETFYEEFVVCSGCRSRVDVADWDDETAPPEQAEPCTT
jgi:hypothetical protein